MAQIEPSDKGGKKKGAQKKIAIHVDFTPMVDMNMLLITFFMLCTTMIQQRTVKIFLPSNDQNIQDKDRTEANKKDAVTLILDTEYKDAVHPMKDANGNTLHRVYYYEGEANQQVANVYGQNRADKGAIQMERFFPDEANSGKGIGAILRQRHKEAMDQYDDLKKQWRNKQITKAEFDEKAAAIRADEKLDHPVVIIKPGPNATYESLIYAIDQLNINQIDKYSIETPTAVDTIMLKNFSAANPNVPNVIMPNKRNIK